jgi:uncharacterized protein YndB with AHSA1/START domain
MAGDPAAQCKDFVISRVFDAPRDLLWPCFTDPERMKHWWGPKGFTVIASKMDLRVGGTYHYGMTAPAGSPMWGLFTDREIVSQERLVFVNSFSDETGGVNRHPGHQKWPLQMLSIFTFADAAHGKTKFTVRWQALNATPEEQATFDSDQSRVSMTNGWTGTMEQLDAYLAKTKQGG